MKNIFRLPKVTGELISDDTRVFVRVREFVFYGSIILN